MNDEINDLDFSVEDLHPLMDFKPIREDSKNVVTFITAKFAVCDKEEVGAESGAGANKPERFPRTRLWSGRDRYLEGETWDERAPFAATTLWHKNDDSLPAEKWDPQVAFAPLPKAILEAEQTGFLREASHNIDKCVARHYQHLLQANSV